MMKNKDPSNFIKQFKGVFKKDLYCSNHWRKKFFIPKSFRKDSKKK